MEAEQKNIVATFVRLQDNDVRLALLGETLARQILVLAEQIEILVKIGYAVASALNVPPPANKNAAEKAAP